jgi:LPS export ABC transporter protein LptC
MSSLIGHRASLGLSSRRRANVSERGRRDLLSCCALMIALTAAACTEDRALPPVAARAPSLADSADQVMFLVRHSLADNGVKRGELTADTGYVFQSSSRYEFRKVRVEFNTPTGVKDGTLTAKRGVYMTRFGQLEAYGDVVVITTDGKKLTSQELRYNQATNEIATDSAFVFEDGQRIQRGVGLRTDPKLSRIQILGQASGEVKRVPVPQGRP